MSGDDDLLERATRALRDSTSPSDEELRIERAVLLRAHRARANKGTSRSRTLRWVLPLAAVLTAGSALAATGQIEVAVEAIARLIAPEREHSRAEPRKKSPRAREEVVRQQREPVLPPPLPVAPPAVVPQPEPAPAPQKIAPPPAEPRRSAPRPPRESKETAVAREAESAPESVPDAAPSEAATAIPNGDLMRYRDAHELHFRARDFWSALRAWESYLRTYPDGTFAVEARYNRAICLVRLGRKDEARRALAPFAAGEVASGYRKNEAAELLKALE